MPLPQEFVDFHFPLAGIDRTQPLNKQPARPIGGGDYARTCYLGVNVRGYEGTTNRARGGSRPGISKYFPDPLVFGWVVQELQLMVTVGVVPGGGTVQTSNSGRVVQLIGVAQGNVYVGNAGSNLWTTPTNMTGDTPPLEFDGVMQCAANIQKLWFADGVNWVYYDPALGQVLRWTPATEDLKGNAIVSLLPVDEDGNTPRLICTWRGRTVLAGLLKDPQNWFMSAVNDPRNFDYAPLSETPTQAIAGNVGPQGLIGDVITGLVPYTDDVLVFLCDHSVFMLRGDPMAGGQIDLISDKIGGAYGIAWEKDPYGNIYFVSNRTGIYTLVPGQQPVRISQAIEQLIQPIDTGLNAIRLIWDDRFQGLHVFITLLAEPAECTHYFYEQRTGAWWQDKFKNNDHNPLCCVTYDGNLPTDRVPLIGSWDGFVRAIDPDATTDDGFVIESSVILGPIVTKDLDDVTLKELQAVLAEGSGAVTFTVMAGKTAELALEAARTVTGTWKARRNLTNLIRRSGHVIYVKLTSSDRWAMEAVRALVVGNGAVRRRGS